MIGHEGPCISQVFRETDRQNDTDRQKGTSGRVLARMITETENPVTCHPQARDPEQQVVPFFLHPKEPMI